MSTEIFRNRASSISVEFVLKLGHETIVGMLSMMNYSCPFIEDSMLSDNKQKVEFISFSSSVDVVDEKSQKDDVDIETCCGSEIRMEHCKQLMARRFIVQVFRINYRHFSTPKALEYCFLQAGKVRCDRLEAELCRYR